MAEFVCHFLGLQGVLFELDLLSEIFLLPSTGVFSLMEVPIRGVHVIIPRTLFLIMDILRITGKTTGTFVDNLMIRRTLMFHLKVSSEDVSWELYDGIFDCFRDRFVTNPKILWFVFVEEMESLLSSNLSCDKSKRPDLVGTFTCAYYFPLIDIRDLWAGGQVLATTPFDNCSISLVTT